MQHREHCTDRQLHGTITKGDVCTFVIHNYDTDTIFPVPTKDWKENTIDKDTFRITFRRVGVDTNFCVQTCLKLSRVVLTNL